MAGRKSKGSLLQLGDGNISPGPEVFTGVALLTNFKPPKFGAGRIDTTSFDSSADEHVTDGTQQHGEIPIEGFWLPEHATHDHLTGLEKVAKDGLIRNFKVVVSTAAGTKTYAFAASVDFSPNVGGNKDALKFSATLYVSGGVAATVV